MDKRPKDKKKGQNKEELAMVNVGKKKPMKSEYWSKKPDQKAVFVSSPQSTREGPIRSKTVQCHNAKPMLKCTRTRKHIHTGDKKHMSKSSHPHETFYENKKRKRTTNISPKNSYHRRL